MLPFKVSGENSVSKIVVVGNHAPPFRIIEEGRFYGIYFDIMSEIASRLEIPVEYKEVPFKRALKLMESGAADIMLGPNRTPERELYMVYTNATVGKQPRPFTPGRTRTRSQPMRISWARISSCTAAKFISTGLMTMPR